MGGLCLAVETETVEIMMKGINRLLNGLAYICLKSRNSQLKYDDLERDI